MKNTFAHIKKATASFLDMEVKDAYKKKYLLAVSGGGDSVLLAHIFNALKLKFAIAHVNYSLRAKESDADAVFVKNLAKKLKVDFHYKKVNTKKLQKKGDSIQMIARDIRYAFFEEILEEEKSDFVVLAHHAGDQVETVLMNLFRGCGIKGLTGMGAKNGNKLRPFLSIPHIEITNALKDQKIKFRTDSSNAKSDYKRNFLRNEVMPLLEKKWPGLENTMLNNIKLFKAAQQIIGTIPSFAPDFDHGFVVAINELTTNPVHVTQFAKKAHENGFDLNTLIKKIVGAKTNESKILKGAKGTLEFKNKKIHYAPFVAQQTSPKLELKQNQLIVSGLDHSFFKSHSERISKQHVKGKIRLCKWKPGDKMVPLGMSGSKKISDILTDLKLTAGQKSEVFVLWDDKKPLWLVGFRIDNRVKLEGNEPEKAVLTLRLV